MINYTLLTKPGIILGNLFTVAAGFLLASKGQFHFWLFLATLLGIALIIASACVCNNYIDRAVDQKMERTRKRPLVQGLITGPNALTFAAILGVSGVLVLFLFTNVLALLVASAGFFVYVFMYSFWKCHTLYATAIGSIAGAVPPVVGYCAASNRLDLGALVLFAMLILWQMPHFYSIAIAHLDDYRRANIPVLPVEKGMRRTKIHMALYIGAFIVVALLLTILGYTGQIYLTLTLVVGLLWLALCLIGFQTANDKNWAKQMFRCSLLMIGTVCLIIPFDVAS